MIECSIALHGVRTRQQQRIDLDEGFAVTPRVWLDFIRDWIGETEPKSFILELAYEFVEEIENS